MTERLFSGSVRRLNDADARGFLLGGDLAVKFLHRGPVHLGPEMVLSVVAVVENGAGSNPEYFAETSAK